MASYVDSVLTKNEVVVYRGSISIFALLPLILIGIPLIFFFGLGLLLWIYAAVLYVTTELAITNKRVIAKFGFISRETIEQHIMKVENIQVRQGILGRMFGYGDLVISGAGAHGTPIPSIADPLNFRKVCLETQDQLRDGTFVSPVSQSQTNPDTAHFSNAAGQVLADAPISTRQVLPVALPAPSAVAAPAVMSGSTAQACPECSAMVAAGHGFCGMCGHRIPVGPPTCKQCNLEVGAADMFCVGCGFKLQT